MKEFKIIPATHSRSSVAIKKDYAIIASTHLIAEPDASEGLVYNNDNDIYVIARDIQHASDMLNAWVTKVYGRNKS